jgi:hypothetical protein
MIKRFGRFLSALFEQHKLVRRSLVTFAMSLVGWTTYVLYTNLELVTTTIVSLHTITIGILSAAIGRYFYERHREDGFGTSKKEQAKYGQEPD